jgi:hypothetical protein
MKYTDCDAVCPCNMFMLFTIKGAHQNNGCTPHYITLDKQNHNGKTIRTAVEKRNKES